MFIGQFENQEDVLTRFSSVYGEVDDSITQFMKRKKIIFAIYDSHDYDGSAFVLIKSGKKLYEVNGSHCSCYGLEDQWEPEEVTLIELIHRMSKGSLCNGELGDYREQLCQALADAKIIGKRQLKKVLKLMQL